MTRTISLIIGIAVLALVAVPTAFGEGRLAGSQQSEAVAPDWFERAAIAAQRDTTLVSRPDTHEVTQPFAYVDASERASRASSYQGRAVGLSGDHIDVRPTDASTPVASSGGELEWPQIGVGFGVGIVLVLGLIMVLRSTRQRPLAH